VFGAVDIFLEGPAPFPELVCLCSRAQAVEEVRLPSGSHCAPEPTRVQARKPGQVQPRLTPGRGTCTRDSDSFIATTVTLGFFEHVCVPHPRKVVIQLIEHVPSLNTRHAAYSWLCNTRSVDLLTPCSFPDCVIRPK
jgi:hypothetical protein